MAAADRPDPAPDDADRELPDRAALRGPRRALLRWFDAHRRDLPWRGSRDPWAVLVSEIMLQQTTVAAVTPYYERFLERWPTAADLAAAPTDELLAAWAGLGYYRRARNLQAAARELAARPRGDAEGLRELPGVGEYTAAAVASITFDEPVAAVDGNVERVVSRLAALPGDPRKAAGKRAVRAVAEALLDRRRPGDFNQAVMDLGSGVCRPREPRCEACPLASACAAHAAGRETDFPRLPPRPEPTPVVRLAALVSARGKVLARLRDEAPNEGFLELPSVDLPAPLAAGLAAGKGPAAPEAVRAELDRLVEALRRDHGLELRPGAALPVHRHTITRYRIQVHPFVGTLSSGRVRPPLRWVGGAPDQPFTTATRRILARDLPDLFTATTDGR